MSTASRKISENKTKDYGKFASLILTAMLVLILIGVVTIVVSTISNQRERRLSRTIAEMEDFHILGTGEYTEEEPAYLISFTIPTEKLESIKANLVSKGFVPGEIREISNYYIDNVSYSNIQAKTYEPSSFEESKKGLGEHAKQLTYSLVRKDVTSSEIKAFNLAYDDAVKVASAVLRNSESNSFYQAGITHKAIEYDPQSGSTKAVVELIFKVATDEIKEAMN